MPTWEPGQCYVRDATGAAVFPSAVSKALGVLIVHAVNQVPEATVQALREAANG